MTIEQPKFPTPEDERRASLMYQALRDLVDVKNSVPAPVAAEAKQPAES